jgi:hypothetical protein
LYAVEFFLAVTTLTFWINAPYRGALSVTLDGVLYWFPIGKIPYHFFPQTTKQNASFHPI